jgi:hypothetical protein
VTITTSPACWVSFSVFNLPSAIQFSRNVVY